MAIKGKFLKDFLSKNPVFTKGKTPEVLGYYCVKYENDEYDFGYWINDISNVKSKSFWLVPYESKIIEYALIKAMHYYGKDNEL